MRKSVFFWEKKIIKTNALPRVKVIIFASPAPKLIWKAIHFQKLLCGDSTDSTEKIVIFKTKEKLVVH